MLSPQPECIHGIKRSVYGDVTPNFEINPEAAKAARVQDFMGARAGVLCRMYTG